MSSDLREITDESLVHLELGIEREMVEASFRHRTNQLEDTSKLKKLRRSIAQLRTEQRRREKAAGVATDSLRNQHRATFRPGAAVASGKAAGGFLKGVADRFGIGGDEAASED